MNFRNAINKNVFEVKPVQNCSRIQKMSLFIFEKVFQPYRTLFGSYYYYYSTRMSFGLKLHISLKEYAMQCNKKYESIEEKLAKKALEA